MPLHYHPYRQLRLVRLDPTRVKRWKNSLDLVIKAKCDNAIEYLQQILTCNHSCSVVSARFQRYGASKIRRSCGLQSPSVTCVVRG